MISPFVLPICSRPSKTPVCTKLLYLLLLHSHRPSGNTHLGCCVHSTGFATLQRTKPLFLNRVPLIHWARKMVRKGFEQAKTGIEYLKSVNYNKYLRKVGVGKEDWYFWKQVGKALLCTYTLMGAVWLYNETSPLGWWTLKPRPKEERELAHLYERREFPYPGDEEAMEEFVAKGGMIGTTIGPKGVMETEKDGYNYQKELQNKKFDQEAHKLWVRMRNEVIQELQDKGYDVE